jgi:hypothetical protein
VRLASVTAALVLAYAIVPEARRTIGADLEAMTVRLGEAPGGPAREALTAALAAYERARDLGVVSSPRLLTLIDYTLPSLEPRLWVIDLQNGLIRYRELVAHGRRSGENMTTAFSNDPETHMTSLGLFVTEDAYVGKNGYSLRLRGLEPGINDNASVRAIVIHGAAYVSREIGARLGRLGRSLGCPAVRPAVARPLIDAIKGGSVVYAFGSATPQSSRKRLTN